MPGQSEGEALEMRRRAPHHPRSNPHHFLVLLFGTLK